MKFKNVILGLSFFFGYFHLFSQDSEIYIVRKNDTLYRIATNAGITVGELKRYNRLESDDIRENMALILPPGSLNKAQMPFPGSIPNISKKSEKPLEGTPIYEYIVKDGESLITIARDHGITVNNLKKINNIYDDIIFPGEKLRLVRNPFPGEQYLVRPGDTPGAIAVLYNLEISELNRLNPGKLANLKIGDYILVSSSKSDSPKSTVSAASVKTDFKQRTSPVSMNEENNSQFYIVVKGDTAWSLSGKFGLSLDHFYELNPQTKVRLNIGDKIVVPRNNETASQEGTAEGVTERQPFRPDITDISDIPGIEEIRFVLHTVVEGETLWRIREKYGVSIQDILLWNPDSGNILSSGDILKIPQKNSSSNLPVSFVPQEEDTTSSDAKEKEEVLDYREMYYTEELPRLVKQPNMRYSEDYLKDPVQSYRKAQKLLKNFDAEIARLPRRGSQLAGYHIVIDPGHGGRDPGFVKQTRDGLGNPLYLIEDEYAYDMSLRLYRELKLYGASVKLTIISPNHTIVNTHDPSITLVNQMNEVYNSSRLNISNDNTSWPFGNASGLGKRITVAEEFFASVPKEKRLFVSIHNDISENDKKTKLVLFFEDGYGKKSATGEVFAKEMIKSLGKDAHVRGQDLYVLRNNPAYASVLIEVRNIAYSDNSWAIRLDDLRQKDSEMVANGILRYVASKN